MTQTERAARHRRKRRLIAAAALVATASACAAQPPPATPGALSERDVIKLRSLDPTPRKSPAKARVKPKPHHTPTHISTALSIRRLRVTAYCYTGSRTYTGVWPRQGMAAVKRSTGIPFGAVLHVEGYGTFTVTDREPEYGASNVDLYEGWRPDCESWAANFGIRHLKVEVLAA